MEEGKSLLLKAACRQTHAECSKSARKSVLSRYLRTDRPLKLRIAEPRVDKVRTTQVCVLELGSGQGDASTR